MGSRLLTENEIYLASQVYGDLIDYSKVRIYNEGWSAFLGFQNDEHLVTPNGNIYYTAISDMPRADDQQNTVDIPDFSESTDDFKALFIHEMGHVLQNQNGENVWFQRLKE